MFSGVLQTREFAPEQNRTDFSRRLFVLLSKQGVLSVWEETSHVDQVNTEWVVNPGSVTP